MVDIGRVVPAEGQDVGARHMTREQELQAYLPVAEIRKGHNRPTPYAKHVLEYRAGMPGRLKRLRQDHVVKRIVRIVTEIGVGVDLNDSQALRHAFVNALVRSIVVEP